MFYWKYFIIIVEYQFLGKDYLKTYDYRRESCTALYILNMEKVKVIMKKCKKLMNGRKIEESRDYVIKNAKSCERMKKETFKN